MRASPSSAVVVSHRRAASRHSPAERGEERQAPRRREMRPLGRGSLRAGEFPVAQRGCDRVNASAHPADVEREAIQLRKFEVEIASISSGPAALRIGKRKHRDTFPQASKFRARISSTAGVRRRATPARWSAAAWRAS